MVALQKYAQNNSSLHKLVIDWKYFILNCILVSIDFITSPHHFVIMMRTISLGIFLLLISFLQGDNSKVLGAPAAHLSVYPRGCDTNAAALCEYEFLLCKLFSGPANDQTTLCNCAKEFYGSCLRLAGVLNILILCRDYSSFYSFQHILYFIFSVKLQMKSAH